MSHRKAKHIFEYKEKPTSKITNFFSQVHKMKPVQARKEEPKDKMDAEQPQDSKEEPEDKMDVEQPDA